VLTAAIAISLSEGNPSSSAADVKKLAAFAGTAPARADDGDRPAPAT